MFAFHRAIDDNNFQLVHDILKETEIKSRKDLQLLFESKIYGNLYPLHHASYHGFVEICKLLLDHGDDLERKQKDYNYTALYMAVKAGQEKTVEFLLNRRADLTIQTGRYNDTLLHTATLNRDTEICKLLLKNCSFSYSSSYSLVNEKNNDGCTPLHYATKYGYKEISDILKKAGGDMDVKDLSMKTPRMYEEDFQKRNDEFQKNWEQYREIDTFGRFLPRKK